MKTNNLGLLALRVGVGGTLVAHGLQKLRGREGATQAFGHMGFPNPEQAFAAATACEIGGGTMLALGLATPAAAGAAIGAMGVAVDVHRPNGFFAQGGGYEFPLTLGVAAGGLALTGPGACSLDHLLGHRLSKPWMALAALAAGIVGSVLVSRQRQSAPADPDMDVAAEGGVDQELPISAVS
jgi:putative oxidoreductase